MSSRCECGAWEGYSHKPGCRWDEPPYPEDAARLRALLEAYRSLAKAGDAVAEYLATTDEYHRHGPLRELCDYDTARATVAKLEGEGREG